MMQQADRPLRVRMHLGARWDRRPALAACLVALSLLSGTSDFALKDAAAAPPSFTIEPGAKSGKQGHVAVDIEYRGMEGGALLFRVAMNTMKMDAPALAEYDLLKLAHLVVSDGHKIQPSRWTIERSGHMGHHVRGTLTFNLKPVQRAFLERTPTSFEIVVRDVAGVETRTFSFQTTPRGSSG